MDDRNKSLAELEAEAKKLRAEVRAKLIEINAKQARRTPFGSFFSFGIGRRKGR